MCTQLIPVREDLKISKERGEYSLLGKGGRERNYLVPRRQHKAYMVKAKLPELQFSRSLTRRWRKDSRKAILTGYLQSDEVKVIPSSQRATHIGGRERTEYLRKSLLVYWVNTGSPKLVRGLSPSTSKVTEPPY